MSEGISESQFCPIIEILTQYFQEKSIKKWKGKKDLKKKLELELYLIRSDSVKINY